MLKGGAIAMFSETKHGLQFDYFGFVRRIL